MNRTTLALAATMLLLPPLAAAQEGPDAPGRRGPPGPFGPGGFGGGLREEIELVEAHDENGDGWLNSAERRVARADLAERRANGGGDVRGARPGRGPRFGGGDREPAAPGTRVAPGDVETYPDAALYDAGVLRTIFLEFESDDWEAELQDFHGTDVEVPARMTVDGAAFPLVGVRFRGMSSYMMVPAGYKRSFDVSLDLADGDQRLYGYKTLNLLNCNGDPSLMSAVLYSELADPHLAVPKANFVRVVINGECWGVYANVQQFDKIFTEENFGSSKGTRWKVPGSPGGDGGLGYLGEDLEPYEARYEMKSDDGKKAWASLVELCRVLNETPLDRLTTELEPLLDLDGALWFLAYDVAFSNSDGYWTRASDYSLFLDGDGRFHLIPHDMNEAFEVAARGPGFGGPGGLAPPEGFGRRPGGPPGGEAAPGDDRFPAREGRARGGRRGGPGGGVELDPLVGLDDERVPLRSRLLAVPELRERYLGYVLEIAGTSLDWARLGPRIEAHRELINEAVAAETRGLAPHLAFLRATYTGDGEGAYGPEGSLQNFAKRRSEYLLGAGTAANPG